MRKFNRKFLLLAVVFGVAITAASFNFGGSFKTAYALTNTQILNADKRGQTSASFDGKHVAFLSQSQSLAGGGDPDYLADAFLLNVQGNIITRLSAAYGGGYADGDTLKVVLSGNGRYALMESKATNLASSTASYSQGATNVYVRDIKTGTTTLIASGIGGSGINMRAGAISEDGRFVYYINADPLQVVTNTASSLWVKDMTTNTTSRIDTDALGAPGNDSIEATTVDTSCDGRFVTFASVATNLTPSDTNGKTDVFLVDRMNGHTIKNITSSGNDYSAYPRISCDGNSLFFDTAASNLTANDINNTIDLVRYDIPNETLDYVSLDSNDDQFGDEQSTTGAVVTNSSSISSDGRYAAFVAQKYYPSTGLVSLRIHMRDTLSNVTTDVTPAFNGGTESTFPAITGDGKIVFYAYGSWSTGYTLYKAYN